MKAEVERLRWTPRSSLLRLLGLTTVAVALLTACSADLEYGYVESDDGSLSFRHPPAWDDAELKPVALEWIAGVDASDKPSSQNVTNFVLDEPFVVAQVYSLDADNRDRASLGTLRTLALNDRRDPTAGDDPGIRLIFNEPYLDDQGFEGHHMRFEVDFDQGTAVEEHFAVFDPERNRVQRVRVACSMSCFEENLDDIESLFASVRLRP